MKFNLKSVLLDLLFALAGAIPISLATAAACKGSFWQSWLGTGVLSWLIVFLLLRIWRSFDSERVIGLIMLVTLLLRIAFGVFSYAALPVWGYNTTTQNSGFLYSDAEGRDLDAFDIAQRKSPLYTAFTHLEVTDQYGGMMFLSALVYRTLSPDVSRPLLISLLAAFAMAAGVAYLYTAIRSRWSQKMAVWASWIFALYPDGILIGSSQMREPFLIGLTCVAFYAILLWREKPIKALIVSSISMALTFPISVPSGIVLTAIMSSVFLLDWVKVQTEKKKQLVGYAVMTLLTFGVFVGGWLWLRETLYFDAYKTMISSGWITSLVEKFGEEWNIPFVTIYGLTQPLLPAAIFEPSLPFWVVVGIARAIAWYAALPLLLFGFFAAWKNKQQNSWLIRLLVAIFVLWVIISSARAGGDQWDNPRYRFLLLPFMSLILAWAINQYHLSRSRWLWRWTAVLGVFLVVFTDFYAYRYTDYPGLRLPFLWMIAIIGALGMLIVGGGLLFDFFQKMKLNR